MREAARERFAVAFFAGFLVVQLAVPLQRLSEERPARFGWQMFSGVKTPPSFEVVRADGSSEAVRLGAWVGNPRGDLRYEERLPVHLCAELSDVVAVRTTRTRADGAEELRTCR